MPIPILIRSLSLAAVLLAAAACEPDAGTTNLNCAGRDCTSGLTVALEGIEADSASITIETGIGVPWTVTCARDHCAAGVLFADFTPEDIIITVRAGGREMTATASPEYTTHTPNGPHCEPVCRMADIRIAAGGLAAEPAAEPAGW